MTYTRASDSCLMLDYVRVTRYKFSYYIIINNITETLC